MGQHVVLVGSMGVGKTTIGRSLADRLERPFLDSDHEIQRRYDVTGAEIAQNDGVERLHSIELETVDAMLQSASRSVIAPAASVIDTPQGRELLGEGLTVWLDAGDEVLEVRRAPGEHRRDLVEDERRELKRRRSSWWNHIASIRLDASRPVPDLVDQLEDEVTRIESSEGSN